MGQEAAIARLRVLLAMHINVAMGAPNAIVFGRPGTGKTHSLRIASTVVGVPFLAIDATSLVPSGIAGEQVEDLVEALVGSARDILETRGQPCDNDDFMELATTTGSAVRRSGRYRFRRSGSSWRHRLRPDHVS